MKVRVEYNRLDEVQREADERINRGLADGAMMVQETAQSIAPVDTGRFRASISMQRVGNLIFEVFSIVEYGPHLEWGTIYMSAQPTFRPAYERNYQIIIQMMQAELATL